MLPSVNKNVKFYLLSNSFYYGGFDIIGAFLAILITTNITNGSAEMVGFLLAYGMVMRAMLELLISPLTKKINWSKKIKLVAFSYLLYGLAIGLMGFASTMWQVFAIQTCISLIDAACYPLKWSIFTKIIDQNNQEFEWGLEDIMSTLASAAFAALSGIIIEAYSISTLFMFFGGSYFFSGLSFYFIKMKKYRHTL
jgi:predicted MFS family arabinose efflux permease